MSDVKDSDDFANQLQALLLNDRRHYLFLIDEADKFDAHERESDSPTLQTFRRLSEEGACSFILAGFWELYEHAVVDYQSPLKNFAEILQIAELEKPACIELATKPMLSMNISYASHTIIDTLINSTGQRTNLITIACQHILINLPSGQHLIEAGDVHKALQSDDIRKALTGWGSLGANDRERCLNRMIVYLSIEQDNFSSADILLQLEDLGVVIHTGSLERSLEQLELGFILGRNKNRYFYRVPLFREMILEDDPQIKLQNEIRQFKQAQA